MAFVRCYTGTDGQSHFEDLDLLPADIERSIEQAASSITFTRSPNGRFSDWHNAPRRQYAIFLSGGQMEVVIGDGPTRRFGPGDVVLFEDLTGQGHHRDDAVVCEARQQPTLPVLLVGGLIDLVFGRKPLGEADRMW